MKSTIKRNALRAKNAVVGATAGITFAQSMQLANLFPKLVKLFRGDSSSPSPSAAQPLYSCPTERTVAREVPWWWVTAALSVISLRVAEVEPRKIPFTSWETPRVRPRRWGAAAIAAYALLVLVRIWWRRNTSPIGAVWTTRFIASSLTADFLSSSQQRQVFTDLPVVRSEPTKNHTHGASAADRNAGCATAALCARAMGLEPYYVQQSLADVRKGCDGDRSFHWPKDLAIPPREFHFDNTKQAAVLVDVDYYIDMDMLLSRHPGTYFISAFQPTASGKADGEYTFKFLSDQRVEYNVSGGSEFVHHVWDYAGDTLLVEDVSYITKVVVAYHIDRKYIDEHHCLVLLTVIGKFTMPAIIPTSFVLDGRRLQRLKPVDGGHVVLDVIKPDGRYRSVAIVGDHTSVTLRKKLFDAVHAVAIVAKVPITPAMVASNIAPSTPVGLPTERMEPGHAAIVASYLRAGIPTFPPVVYPPSEGFVPIWFAKHDYDAPVPLAGFGSPLIGPCYGFAESIASDDRCISGRVEAFQDTEFEEPIPPTLAKYMAEFVERLIPVPHIGVPVGDDYVVEKQSKPSQRAILDEAGVTGDSYKKGWQAFVKKETYTKPTDPRNISQATPAAKLAYSRYMYAFHNEVLGEIAWYAFNKTPAECAARIGEMLLKAGHAVKADGNRFDGHVKRRARILERICMLRFFQQQFHSGVNEAMDEQVGLSGSTVGGRKYQSAYTRGSGSLETSDFNSILTAFIDYCAWRNTLVGGVKCGPDLAWSKLGIYGGDDSLTGAVDPAALKKSATMMGQDYDLEVVPRGSVGVEFLNRQFGPDVWTGDINSMANPSRLLSKLWVGPAKLREPLVRFGERMSGYYRMDRNSPVVGKIATISHELLGDYVEGVLMPWDGKHSLESNWPNVDSGWMVDIFNASIPDFDWDRFGVWLTELVNTKDPQLLLRAPLCTAAPQAAPQVKQACVVGDTMLVPDDQPKGKEEAVEDGSGEESSDSWVVMKMTPEGLEKHAVVSLQEVDAAEQLVPVIMPRAVKNQNFSFPYKPAAKPAPAKKEFTDPRTWKAPNKWDQESDTEYQLRLTAWTRKRESVAKRLKIPLEAPPGRGVRKQ